MGSEIKPDKRPSGIDGRGFTVQGVNGLSREGIAGFCFFGFTLLVLDIMQRCLTGEVRKKTWCHVNSIMDQTQKFEAHHTVCFFVR